MNPPPRGKAIEPDDILPTKAPEPSDEAWGASRLPTSASFEGWSSLSSGYKHGHEARTLENDRGWVYGTLDQLRCQIPQVAPKEAVTTQKGVAEQVIVTQGVSMALDGLNGDGNRVHKVGLRRSWGPTAVAADPVVFSCFAPPAVSGGMAFLLRISAYLRQQRDDVLYEARSASVTEAGVPGAMRIMRNKRVTIKLVSKTHLLESHIEPLM